MRRVVVLMLVASLAACGGSNGDQAGTAGPKADQPSAAPTNATDGPPADFNYLDACSVMSKDAVAKAVGSAVTKTELAHVTPVGDAPAGFSNCNYSLADGRTFVLLTRWNPGGIEVGPAFASDQQQMKDMGMAFDIAQGVGDAAYFSMGSTSLSVYSGPHKFYVFQFPLAKISEADAKTQLLAAAKAQGL